MNRLLTVEQAKLRETKKGHNRTSSDEPVKEWQP